MSCLIRVSAVIEWLEEQRRSIVLRYVRGRYLHIGCGNNKSAKEYRARGGDAVGIDVYDFGGADCIVKDTSNLNYIDGAFDSISLIACLNHIPNRDAVLREAYRLLAPDGRVLITMIPPTLSAIWHKIIRPWDEDQTQRGMKEGEVWGISPVHVVMLLRQAGFDEVQHSRFVFGLNHLYVATK